MPDDKKMLASQPAAGGSLVEAAIGQTCENLKINFYTSFI
jgi:hypothetical protein